MAVLISPDYITGLRCRLGEGCRSNFRLLGRPAPRLVERCGLAARERGYTENVTTTGAEEIVEAALRLDPKVRAEVAQEILESLEDSSYAELSPAWEKELDRRVQEVEEGRVEPIPAGQVFAEIEASLRTRRAGK